MVLCKHYINGYCRNGAHCEREHVDGLCRDFFRTGKCKRGTQCRFTHSNAGEPTRAAPLVKGRNTEVFEPSYMEPHMVLKVCTDPKKYTFTYSSNDVALCPMVFPNSETYYGSLLEELKDSPEVWKLWHGDTHLIADERIRERKPTPLFDFIVDRLREYFDVAVKATRFNWYKNEEWKPYHHDAAAIDVAKEKTQNITIAASFGATREIAFQFAKGQQHVSPEDRATLALPLTNGSVYIFGNKVNLDFRHGVPPLRSPATTFDGRISIVIWGWKDVG